MGRAARERKLRQGDEIAMKQKFLQAIAEAGDDGYRTTGRGIVLLHLNEEGMQVCYITPIGSAKPRICDEYDPETEIVLAKNWERDKRDIGAGLLLQRRRKDSITIESIFR